MAHRFFFNPLSLYSFMLQLTGVDLTLANFTKELFLDTMVTSHESHDAHKIRGKANMFEGNLMSFY